MEELSKKGYIYIRDNEWFINRNIIKLGITQNIIDRSNNYITGEIKKGTYLLVIEIYYDKLKILDTCLKNYFKSYHVYLDGGTEFYKRDIIRLIEPYLKLLNIYYKVLSNTEIQQIERTNRLNQIIDKLKNKIKEKHIQNIQNIISNSQNNTKQPNQHQQEILDRIYDFFMNNDIGKIIWACGLGKTLLALFIIKKLKFKSIIIGVPNIPLQKQWVKEILEIFNNNILFIGGDKVDNMTNNIEDIKSFINNNSSSNYQPKFIITTYHSCYLLKDIQTDFKIGDEAHHLAYHNKEDNGKGFYQFHYIQSKKTLYMTATEKFTNYNQQLQTDIHYSMDNEIIFGKYIDIKTIYWAIENKKITDYNILVIKNNEETVDMIINKLNINVSNKDLFISSYMTLKSLSTYHDLKHLLLYTNTTQEAELSNEYIELLLNYQPSLFSNLTRDDIYYNVLHSKNCKNKNIEIQQFCNKPKGIISCVYIFGEGFDLPKLNGVCIASNMNSEIRIVQYLLRPNRLDYNNPDKKAYIIIPYIDNDDWDTKNKPFDKVRIIIKNMRNEDKQITQKIKLNILNDLIYQKRKRDKPDDITNYQLTEDTTELEKLKFRLRYSKTLKYDYTEEQEEYNYIKLINKQLNIKSTEEYIQSKNKHQHFINKPDEYFTRKGVWTNWYDFLGIDTTQFIQDKNKWIQFCHKINIQTLQDYNDCLKLYPQLPKYPEYIYEPYSNIYTELNLITKRRRK